MIFSPSALKLVGALLLFVALIFGFRAVKNHYIDVGKAEVQAKWDADKLRLKQAEELAIAGRNAENAREKERQDRVNQTITEKYHEIDSLRNQLATAKRVRVGAAICGQGSPAPAKATSPEGSDVPDTGARVVREDVERDIRALMIQVEESFATGRACQTFLHENGFTRTVPAQN